MATLEQVRGLKRKYSSTLLRMEGVCGLDIEEDPKEGAILTVHLDTRDSALADLLPRQLEGHELKYVYAGPIRKQ
ncbi:MAG: hypothetical protein HUU16_15860 [Candidatus Omnitrophica bacterium]|nr:hypothetical protein [bacterium]NUN97640.1 hypothetical protein [Candidatus Omnitrophota bacterium]